MMEPAMPPETHGTTKFDGKKIGNSMLVIILFAPIFMAVGNADFRFYRGVIAGVPTYSAFVSVLILIFVGLCWYFSSTAFGDEPIEAEDE